MANEPQEAEVPTAADEQEAEAEMCCKGDGTTAEEHRHEDGACCIDK